MKIISAKTSQMSSAHLRAGRTDEQRNEDRLPYGRAASFE